jgi:phage terminase large subunit-like protein
MQRVDVGRFHVAGKSEVAIARILGGLFLFGEPLVIYSAHEFVTAMEMMRRTEALIANSDLGSEIKRVIRSHGEEGIELRSGARVKFKTRTKVGGRGLSGSCVIRDEAMILSEESIGALMFTVAAQPNPQVWFLGSAVDQAIQPEGRVFASVRQNGIDGTDPRLCYLEWSAEDDDDHSDLRTWAKAVPGMGHRISAEHIAAEYRSLRHSPKTFLTERLRIGDWPA